MLNLHFIIVRFCFNVKKVHLQKNSNKKVSKSKKKHRIIIKFKKRAEHIEYVKHKIIITIFSNLLLVIISIITNILYDISLLYVHLC